MLLETPIVSKPLNQNLQSPVVHSPVFSADALVQPHAVVVVLLHTPPAVPTVLGPHRTHRLARVANVEDGVVVVSIVTPRRRVTNLGGGGGVIDKH